MKSLIWMGNLSDQISVLHEPVTASVSESFTISPDDENDKICKNYKILWVNDNCVYETRRGPLGNEQINEESSTASSIFYPLSSHQIISVHCNYNVYGAISINNQVFMWGQSEKGQCGCMEEFVQRPNLVQVKTNDTVCSHGVHENGRQIQIEQLSFGRSLSLAVAADGSLWSWGSLYDDWPANPIPYPVQLNRKVISVVCGEYHYLALVESLPDISTDQNLNFIRTTNTVGSLTGGDYSSVNFVDRCPKCRDIRLKTLNNDQISDSSNVRNFFDADDSMKFCPLGLKLEFCDQICSEHTSPTKQEKVNSLNFTGDTSSSTSTPLLSTKERKFSSTMPASFFDDAAIEMVEIRKTKSAGNRFSFISFDYNAADSSSSNETLTDVNFLKNDPTEQKIDGVVGVNGSKTKTLRKHDFSDLQVSTEVWAWGLNDVGQLGIGDFIKRSQPYRIDKLMDVYVSKLDAGESHSVALTATGEVYVWGSNHYGQIKLPSKTQPCPVLFKKFATPFLQQIGSQSSVLDVATGKNFTVLLVNNLDWKPEVYYCGQNFNSVECQPIVDRLSNWTKKYSGWPIFVRCLDDFVLLPIDVDEERKLFSKFYEIIFTEIKFAQKLHQIYSFAVELFQKNVLSDAKETELLKEFLVSWRGFCSIVVKNVYVMKNCLNIVSMNSETKISSLFLSVPSSAEYSSALKRLHSFYCQIIASNVFNSLRISDELDPIVRQLASYNDVESSRETRLLRKLFHVPFNRTREYCDIIQIILRETTTPTITDEFEWLTDFVKHMKILEQILSNLFIQSDKTRHFWTNNSSKSQIISLKKLNRFIIKEFSRTDGITSVNENGSSLAFQELYVFSDCFVVILKHAVKIFEFPLLWLVPVPDDVKYTVQLICPENVLSVEFLDGISKNCFVQCVGQSMLRYLNGHHMETLPGVSPPLRRKGRHDFSAKHVNFANSSYVGGWVLGKPHGTGHLVYQDGRQFHGKFKNGLMHGYGEMRNRDESGRWSLIRGYWKESSLTGLAIVNYGNGSVYEGYLKNGMHNGHGVYTKRSQTYFGAWDSDKRRGYGVADRGREKYLGVWENDKEHGSGCLVTLDGVYYEGSFEDGVFVKGRMTLPDSTRYEGEFGGVGILNGKGAILFPNGDKIVGQLNGYVNDSVKITNAEYSRSIETPTSSPRNCFSNVSVNTVPADQKWTDVFGHVYDNLLGVKNSTVPTNQIWDNLVSNLHKLRKLFDSQPHQKVSNSLEGLDTIPDWNRKFDESYYFMVKDYCSMALQRVYHPLGRLLIGLTDVFNATYSGVGAHPAMLPQAISEITSLVGRMYALIRLLFPNLPCESDMNKLLTEVPSDVYIKPMDFETCASFLYDCFLQEVYPTLFTLYVMQNDSQDSRFWSRIKTLNARNDVALLDMFNVDKHLWPIRLNESVRDSNVLDTPMICATARSKYYADAIECLQRLSSEFFPSSKLKVIVDTFYHINECVSQFSSENSSQSHMWSADSLVPVTMYVVVRAQIQRLGAEIRLIEDFCPQLQYLGQVQYLLATLQGCYKHVMEDKNLF